MYPYDEPNGVEAYAQLFRNGSFEMVAPNQEMGHLG